MSNLLVCSCLHSEECDDETKTGQRSAYLKRLLIGSRGRDLPTCFTAVGTVLPVPGRGRDQDNKEKGPKVRHRGEMRDEMKKRDGEREVLKEE